MPPSTRQIERHMRRLLDKADIDRYTMVMQKTGHYKIVLFRGDRKRVMPASGSPSCPKALKRMEAHLNRMVRDLGGNA